MDVIEGGPELFDFQIVFDIDEIVVDGSSLTLKFVTLLFGIQESG